MPSIVNVQHNEINSCINELFDDETKSKIESLFELLYNNQEEKLRKIINDIDNHIGGNNLLDLIDHPLEKMDGNGIKQVSYTGLYNIEDREIFRPLQYALVCFESPNENLHRYSVQMSCVHVEAVCKRILEQRGLKVVNLPLGQLIKKMTQQKMEMINYKIISILQNITLIYNIAKHDCSFRAIPSERRKNHYLMMFTLAETVYMFFICRKIALILDPSIASNDRFRRTL